MAIPVLLKKGLWVSLRSWWRQTELLMKVFHGLRGKVCQTASPLLSMDVRRLMGNTWKVCSLHIWVFHFRNFSASYWREGHIWSVTDSVIGIPTTIAPQSSVLAPNICKDIYEEKYLYLPTKKLQIIKIVIISLADFYRATMLVDGWWQMILVENVLHWETPPFGKA